MFKTNIDQVSAAQALRSQLAEVDYALALGHERLANTAIGGPEAKAIWATQDELLHIRLRVVKGLRHEGVTEFL